MAAMRPTASAAARLMRNAAAPVAARPTLAMTAAPAMRRLESTLAPTKTEEKPAQTAAPVVPRAKSNAPDYTAMTDRATSYVGPLIGTSEDPGQDDDSERDG